MSQSINRRQLLGRSAAALAATAIAAQGQTASMPARASCQPGAPERRFRLGLVTYNLAKDWDVPTILANCKELGLAAVELRTTHKHGVELTLPMDQRKEVKKRFADSPVRLWGLGTVCQYHENDPAIVARNIEETKRWAQLAHDVGAKGVKVRPNGFVKGVEERRTLEQIGRAIGACAAAAENLGVELWVENHGGGTCLPGNMRTIMDVADHSNAGVIWNSNYPADVTEGSIQPGFKLLADKIRSVHINELINPYPYRELFTLLRSAGYDRYTLMEIQGPSGGDPADSLRFARYYAALWEALSQVQIDNSKRGAP